jgi:hypothetical protein
MLGSLDLQWGSFITGHDYFDLLLSEPAVPILPSKTKTRVGRVCFNSMPPEINVSILKGNVTLQNTRSYIQASMLSD